MIVLGVGPTDLVRLMASERRPQPAGPSATRPAVPTARPGVR